MVDPKPSFTVRTFWRFPDLYGSCEIEDEEPCEEDAVTWWRPPGGPWLGACEAHFRSFSLAQEDAPDGR